MELGLSLGDAAGSSKPFEWMEKSHTLAHTRTSRSNKGIGFCMELSIGPTSSVREDGDDDNRKPTQEDEDHHHHEDKQTETAAAAARLVDSAEIRRCSTPTPTAETANIIQQLDLLPNTPVVVPLPRNPTPSSILASFPAANWTSAGSSEAAGSGQMARDANKLPMAIPAPLDLLVPHHNDDEDPSSPEAEDGDGSHGAGALSSSSLNTTSSAQMDFCIHSSNHHHNDTSTTGTGGTNNIRKSCGDIFRASNDNNNEVVDGCSELEDENGCSTRKKLRLSKQQSAFLEESFKEHTTLTPKQKLALAKQLNLRPRQVEVWFQNRRARTKLKQTEVDCEYLKRCCETLTEENRRLQKELQELRALKSTAGNNPFYMQLPATTLTMCPSCERVATTNINPPPLPTTTATPPKATSTSTGSSPLSSRPMFVPFSHHKPTTTDGQI